jgi:phosphoribosylformylglycinamidine synthase
MKFGIVVFPGSNCDRDVYHVLKNVLQQDTVMLWHNQTSLDGFTNNDCIVLPGGFSYGDYLRSGAIARFSPIMKAVIDFARQGGFVFGICNGFQILCEAGLLPGALLLNDHQKFMCKNVFIKPTHLKYPITKGLDYKAYKIPVAHAEGRYYASENVLAEMHINKQIIFQYCNENGEVSAVSNPNGSLESIAGICNVQGNVIGMMPHPERAAENILGNEHGLSLFKSLIDFATVTDVASV